MATNSASDEKPLQHLMNSNDELKEFSTPRASSPLHLWFKGRKGVLIGVGIGMVNALIGTHLLLSSLSSPTTAPTQTDTPAGQSVTVASVKPTMISHRLEATGTVAARDMLPILPEATGLRIREVLVEEGDMVRAGQVMVVLDSAALQAQLHEAQANLQVAQAVVRQKQAALASANTSLAEARSNLQRYQKLAEQGAISQQELVARSTTATKAQEEVGVAQANIDSTQATVESNLAQIEHLQTQIAQTLLRVPANGIVAEKLAHVGDVTRDSKLFSIIRNGSLELQAQVPAAQLAQVKVGASAQIMSDTDHRIQLQGRVREIAPLVDAQTRQATVKIDLPANAFVHCGMFLKTVITTSTTLGLTIPAKAILPQADGNSMVYLLDQANIAHAKTIEVGARQPGDKPTVEVINGLAPGARIIVAGAAYIRDGDRVTVAGN